MDVDNDGDIDIVLKSNFGYFTKDKVSTDDGYDNWQWELRVHMKRESIPIQYGKE